MSACMYVCMYVYRCVCLFALQEVRKKIKEKYTALKEVCCLMGGSEGLTFCANLFSIIVIHIHVLEVRLGPTTTS